MNILVIGGTGFLGSRIVKKLIPIKHTLFVLTRDASRDFLFDKEKVQMIEGDLLNRDFLLGLTPQFDIIVYVAMPPFKVGRISRRRFLKIQSIVKQYIANTLSLARKKDALLIMTLGASFATEGSEIADESWPIARVGMAMAGSCYDEIIEKEKKEGSLKLIEMLPGQIYGSGGLFLKMVKMAQAGKIVILGGGKNIVPRIHVEDCANAYVLAIEKQPVGERFILCDDTPCTVEEFMTYLGMIYGARRILRPPDFILRLFLGKWIFQTIKMNAMVSNAHLKEVLGWSPKYPSYREGLKTLKGQNN